MSSLTISSTLANAALSPLAQYNQSLNKAVDQASSGLAINSAADNPSGLAIYNSLSAQANSDTVAAQNVDTANDAINVASGALSTTQQGLQSLNSLAVEASNDFLSPADRADLQTVANQLVQQINTNAQNAQFNGTQLLSGNLAAATPAQNPVATTTSNASLAGGGQLVNAPAAAATAQAGAITVTVNAGTGGAPATAQVNFTDTATGQTTTVVAAATAGSVVNVNGTQITLGNFGNGDNSATATVQVQAGTAFTQGQAAGVQSGSGEGAVTPVNLPNGTAAANFITNIDLGSSASATDAQGQINEAIQAVATAQAQLGAQSQSLSAQSQSDLVTANNLTASASSIADANEGSVATELALLRTKEQISLATLQNANNTLGYLNRFFNVAA